MEVMEKATPANPAAIDGLLMECEEEEMEVWSPPAQGDEEEEDGPDEGDFAAPAERFPAAAPASSGATETRTAAAVEEAEQLVQVIPIPTAPDHQTPQCLEASEGSGSRLGFTLNGRPVCLQPGGGGAELKLRCHPGGSASGFTTLQQIPVTLTVHAAAGPRCIGTLASLKATFTPPIPASPSSLSAPPPPAEPNEDPTLLITGVVSGEAAEKVLNDHNVNFTPQTLSPPLPAPPSALAPPPVLPVASPPALPVAPPPPSSSRPAASPRPLGRGLLGPAAPPDCPACGSPFKIVTKLRGFMCSCSAALAHSLRHAFRPKHRRGRTRDSARPKPVRSPRESLTPRNSKGKFVSPHQRANRRQSDDFLPDQPVGDGDARSPPPSQQEALSSPPGGKMVVLVEDFYYGTDEGRSSGLAAARPKEKAAGPYRCITCPKTLRSNIKLMSHMLQHVRWLTQQDGETERLTSCQHCFRPFSSPFKLQCHLEAVHSQCESTAKCQICELAFENEPAFLWHMKYTHKPGEMPYVCQVCDFRSSFYSAVSSHFREAHANTSNLLCPYCLKVLRSSSAYQQHLSRHQRKHVFGCDKCRLHFLYLKERIDHKVQHHRTHIRPAALNGLKPGTKVTVRTYSVVGGSGNDADATKRLKLPCKVINVHPGSPKQPVKRKPVEGLGTLLSNLSMQGAVESLEKPPRCLECVYVVSDFSSHFPSLVRCSLCRFVTCCSRAYANHMISKHVNQSSSTQYRTMFRPWTRLQTRLSCVSCMFSTIVGEAMANHLADHPEHHASTFTHGKPADQQVNAAGQTTHRPLSTTERRSFSSASGSFIPIHLVPSGTPTAQLSVKRLASPSPLSAPPAMTIKFLGPPPGEAAESVASAAPLSEEQMAAVLYSLCNGLPQAAQHYATPPPLIQAWMQQMERERDGRPWSWSTDRIAEWVLSQREQQLCVSEETLLKTAAEALGEQSGRPQCYRWAVNLMLHHSLGLQSWAAAVCRAPPRNIYESARIFTRFLHRQIESNKLQPDAVTTMDELSVFIDKDQFAVQNPAAFQLFGTGSMVGNAMFDIVLSGLADGTFFTPMLFFRGQEPDVPDGFPDNVFLEARAKGFSDQRRLDLWLNKVWRPHVATLHGGRSLLIMDTHRGHMKDRFLSDLHLHTVPAVIPIGCSCRLQPLDVCVTPVVREFLQARWSQLLSQGGAEGLGLGDLALTLACWLSEISSTLAEMPHILRRSFTIASKLLNEEDGEEAAGMIQTLTEALIRPLEAEGRPEEPLQVTLVLEEKRPEKKEEAAPAQGSSSLQALHQVFDGDSDPESFHGF